MDLLIVQLLGVSIGFLIGFIGYGTLATRARDALDLLDAQNHYEKWVAIGWHIDEAERYDEQQRLNALLPETVISPENPDGYTVH